MRRRLSITFEWADPEPDPEVHTAQGRAVKAPARKTTGFRAPKRPVRVSEQEGQ